MDSEKLKVVFEWVVRIAVLCALLKIVYDVILAEHTFFN